MVLNCAMKTGDDDALTVDDRVNLEQGAYRHANIGQDVLGRMGRSFGRANVRKTGL